MLLAITYRFTVQKIFKMCGVLTKNWIFGGKKEWKLQHSLFIHLLDVIDGDLVTYWGYVVVQLSETLRYKPEHRGFNFLLIPFRPHFGPGVSSASNRIEYQVSPGGLNVAGV